MFESPHSVAHRSVTVWRFGLDHQVALPALSPFVEKRAIPTVGLDCLFVCTTAQWRSRELCPSGDLDVKLGLLLADLGHRAHVWVPTSAKWAGRSPPAALPLICLQSARDPVGAAGITSCSNVSAT